VGLGITFGFIKLFLLYVLPGYIFKLLYYKGQFSREFSSSRPILQVIFYSLAPSFLLHIIAFFLDKICFKLIYSKDIDDLVKFFTSIDGEEYFESALSDETTIYYLIFVYVVSVALGLLSFLIVRTLNLDIGIKLFRFKNKWHYIFSGEVLKFKKFRDLKEALKSKYSESFKSFATNADVLVKSDSEKNRLYSGMVLDYDLDPENIHKIDKLYLSQASRINKSGDRRNIPGEMLIIQGENIENINLIYLQKKNATSKKTGEILFVIGLGLIFLMFPLVFFFIFKVETIENMRFLGSLYSFLFNNFGYIGRIFVWVFLMPIFWSFLPIRKVGENYTIKSFKAYLKEIVQTIIASGFILIIIYIIERFFRYIFY